MGTARPVARLTSPARVPGAVWTIRRQLVPVLRRMRTLSPAGDVQKVADGFAGAAPFLAAEYSEKSA
jgi:hypothetical protein